MDCVFYVKGESKTFRPRIKEFKSFFPLLISLKPKWGFFSQKITFPLITIFNNIFTFHNFSIYFILLGRFRWKLTPLTFPMRMPMARRISAHSHSFSIETKRFFHEIETTLDLCPFFLQNKSWNWESFDESEGSIDFHSTKWIRGDAVVLIYRITFHSLVCLSVDGLTRW